MVRLNIDTDAECYPCVSVDEVTHSFQSYTEVPDELWQRYQQTRAAFEQAERELVDWHRSHPAVDVDDEEN